MRNARSSPPSTFAAGTLAVRGLFAAGVLCLVAGAGLYVAQPGTANGGSAEGQTTVEDIQLTLEARRFLNQDATLEPLNLGVVVRNRVVTLAGPVPSPVEKQRAEERMRQLRGVVQVVSELSVELPEDKAVNSFAPLPRARVARTDPTAGERGPPVQAFHTASPKRGTVPPPEDTSLERLPPIRLSVQGSATVSTSKPVVPFSEDRQAQLVQQVERIRQSEARFHSLEPEVANGIILLRGSVARGEDQIAFTDRVRTLAGVEKVVIAGVRVRGQ